MTVRSYLWGMRLSTLAAMAALAAVISLIDPSRDGVLGQTLFYITSFFSITGLATLFLFWLRRRFAKNEVVYENVGVSFREGMIIAIAVVGMFALQSARLLIWWDAGMVMAGALLVELWFLSK